jgi:CheY-like chemotaxis protein
MPDNNQIRILIVDDQVDAAEALELTLEKSQRELHVVHNGPDALAVAALFKPHFAFIDILLPGINGYDVARAMRKMEVLTGRSWLPSQAGRESRNTGKAEPQASMSTWSNPSIGSPRNACSRKSPRVSNLLVNSCRI